MVISVHRPLLPRNRSTLVSRPWFPLFVCLLGLTVLFSLRCDKISPGVNGRITLEDNYLVSDKAQQIVVAVYRPADFDPEQALPKLQAKPLVHRILNSVHHPPYDYELEANFPGERVYVFAFLDQDNSGGLYPTHTDLSGVHPNNPVLLSEIRLFNVFIRLDRLYLRPPIRFEINRTLQVDKPVTPNRLVVNLWRPQDTESNVPKLGAVPLASQALTTFTNYSPWVIEVKVDHINESVIPFVFVDKDGKGGEHPAPGDTYVTWKTTSLPLQKAYTQKIELVLDSIYTSKP